MKSDATNSYLIGDQTIGSFIVVLPKDGSLHVKQLSGGDGEIHVSSEVMPSFLKALRLGAWEGFDVFPRG